MKTRRDFLRQLAVASVGGLAVVHPWLLGCRHEAARERTARSQAAAETGRRYLLVIGATGGASIIDSFLAIRASEAGAAADTLNCFPDAEVADVSGTPFRAVNTSVDSLGPIPLGGTLSIEQQSFVQKHHADMLVATVTGSSVNHAVAQHRAVTGGGAWQGRTLQELCAETYGADQPLANVRLTNGNSFGDRGGDDSLSEHAYAVPVADPVLWPMGLHGARGIDGAPKPAFIEMARKLRNDRLDAESPFNYTFQKSEALERWIRQRDRSTALEAADLIGKLNLLPDGDAYPLSAYGLEESPDGAMLREVFPDYARNPVEAQAALAFLLLKNDVSSAVTLAPSFDLALGADIDLSEGLAAGVEELVYNLPLAFDFSHTGHRSSQAFMWRRTLGIVDRLIDLLKNEPAPEGDGDSMWDRTCIYIATDFGRDKKRPSGADEWSTGHELNNGVVILSPMARGNSVLGGVDPQTGYTYGFDPQTGAPDPGRTMQEKEIFAGIAQIMGIDTSPAGLPDVSAMRR